MSTWSFQRLQPSSPHDWSFAGLFLPQLWIADSLGMLRSFPSSEYTVAEAQAQGFIENAEDLANLVGASEHYGLNLIKHARLIWLLGHLLPVLRARRPELDRMMDEARRHKFDVLLVWSCDRLARSTKHLLQTIDELKGMGIQFLSQREAIDTEGPLGRAILVIVSAMAELERCILIERVRAGMRRARLEGRQIGRARLDVDRQQVIQDRRSGLSLTQVAKKHRISRASVCRLMKVASGTSHCPVSPEGASISRHK